MSTWKWEKSCPRRRLFCLFLFSLTTTGNLGNWFQHMLQSSSKMHHPYVPTFLTNNISALIGLCFWSLLLHCRFYGQGLSYTPNLCCSSKLEREGLQNATKFTGGARFSLLKQCLKDLDS